MSRFVSVAALVLATGLLVPYSSAQVTSLARPPVDDSDTPVDATAPATPAEPARVIDPKTKLPVSAEELREKELDKLDPTRKLADDEPDANRLTDRDQPATPEQPKKEDTTSQSAPLPGSVAASKASSAVSGATTDSGEFAGPAVLTRSYTLARPNDAQNLNLTSNVGISESWTQGQGAGVQSADGAYPSTLQRARSFSWSLAGRHTWKRDQLGLSYSGSYSDSSASSLTGLNHTLNFDLSHPISRRMSIHFVESLQALSQNYAVENPALQPGSSVANINLATSPNVQLPGNSTKQSNSSLTLSWQKTARTSLSLSASRFLIGHTGTGFTGNKGFQFGADANYRLSYRSTVGASYSYTQYNYSHDISSSYSHSVGVIYSYALSASTQLRSRIGVSRIETQALSQVALPPEIAFFLGQQFAVIDAYNRRRSGDISAELVKDFGRNRTANLAYSRGESPGNGLLMTSIQESVTAGYSARLLRRIPASLGYSRSTMNSTSNGSASSYESDTFFISTSRQIGKRASSSIQLSYRRYQITGTPLSQHDLRLSCTLNWNLPQNWLRF